MVIFRKKQPIPGPIENGNMLKHVCDKRYESNISKHITSSLCRSYFCHEMNKNYTKISVWSKIWRRKNQRVFNQKLSKHFPNNRCWRSDSIETPISNVFVVRILQSQYESFQNIQLENYFKLWFSSFGCAKRVKFIACEQWFLM